MQTLGALVSLLQAEIGIGPCLLLSSLKGSDGPGDGLSSGERNTSHRWWVDYRGHPYTTLLTSKASCLGMFSDSPLPWTSDSAHPPKEGKLGIFFNCLLPAMKGRGGGGLILEEAPAPRPLPVLLMVSDTVQ